MSTPQALEAATRIGERARQRYIRTGILPRNPFRADSSSELAAAWRKAALAPVKVPVPAGFPDPEATPQP